MPSINKTRPLLLIGFGGLLLLLAFTGLNTLSVINRLQRRNETIRLDYVNRDRVLEDLRSSVYLSGTYVRDFLQDPNEDRAQQHRMRLVKMQSHVEAIVRSYQGSLRGDEQTAFDRFKSELDSYFDSLRPVLEWDAAQRKQQGFAFMQHSLLPRRSSVVELADQIGRLNQDQMNSGNARVVELFSTFRTEFILLFLAALLGGMLLAGGSIYRILRLEAITEQARQELEKLSARLVDVQETERRALSRELHDEVGQALSALLLALGNAAAMISLPDKPEVHSQLLETRHLAERTVAIVREMCLFLRPSMLDDLGLLPALEWQAREISRTSPVRVSVQTKSSLEDLTDEQKTCIYRVAQEALRNVVRHARAKTAHIQIEKVAGGLHLTIRDDGQGFSPERQRGLGLLGMNERVKHLDGSFQIFSSAGEGTLIEVRLPGRIAA